MTGISDVLPDFGALATARALPKAGGGAVDLEAERLAAFESGYKAGWDDAAKAHADEQQHISSALGQNLLDLGFTHAEVQAQTMKALVPLLQQITEVLLPEIAKGAVTAHIVQELEKVAKESIQTQVEIRVAPEAVEATQAVLSGDSSLPVTVISDSALGEGQADLSFADTELQIDLQDALTEVRHLIAGFAHETQKEVVNG